MKTTLQASATQHETAKRVVRLSQHFCYLASYRCLPVTEAHKVCEAMPRSGYNISMIEDVILNLSYCVRFSRDKEGRLELANSHHFKPIDKEHKEDMLRYSNSFTQINDALWALHTLLKEIDGIQEKVYEECYEAISENESWDFPKKNIYIKKEVLSKIPLLNMMYQAYQKKWQEIWLAPALRETSVLKHLILKKEKKSSLYKECDDMVLALSAPMPVWEKIKSFLSQYGIERYDKQQELTFRSIECSITELLSCRA